MSIPNPPFGLLPNAPMQTQLVDNQRSVTPPWGGWLNFLRQWLFLNIPTIITSSGGVSASANPMANGAVGDSVHDDTAIVQQTINQTGGVLYLPPGKLFFCSSSILLPTNVAEIVIYGGGGLNGTANPVINGTANVNGNIQIIGVQFTSTTAGATLVSIANQTTGQGWDIIEGCFFGTPGGAASTAIALNGNTSTSWAITGCIFQSNVATGVALTNQTTVEITGCVFKNSTGSSVSTSGTCTYNLIGNYGGGFIGPHFGAPVLNQYAEFTGTTQAITAGPSFVNVTSCSFTISVTGTWHISANAFVQQAAAAANTATIRFTRNGTGDTHTAASGSPAAGEFMLHFDTQIALSSGDVIQLQCLATTANVTLLGTGSSGTTNIGGVFVSV